MNRYCCITIFILIITMNIVTASQKNNGYKRLPNTSQEPIPKQYVIHATKIVVRHIPGKPNEKTIHTLAEILMEKNKK